MSYKRISPSPVIEGGTGDQSFTAYAVIAGGTTSTGPLQSLAGVGTLGQFLTSNGAGLLPTFQTAGASSISVTGDTGGALVSSAFIFTGGTSGLKFGGSGSTETISGTLAVGNGGTGATNLTGVVTANDGSGPYTASAVTQHSVLVGGASNLISSVAVGTTGQVLTGVTGADPTFQSPAASSISITGNSGGALTGAAFTFTGGTTGLTFAGAGTTETLGGTLAIANGGTNATSFTQTNGIVTYNGTRLVNYAGPQISSAGIQTNTTQPMFSAYNSAGASNVTGDATVYTVVFDTALTNQGSNYNTGTSTFTAPVTGQYLFITTLEYGNITVANTTAQISIVVAGTSASANIVSYLNPGVIKGGGNVIISNNSVLVKMTATDTATVTLQVIGSTKTIAINAGTAGSPNTSFSGYLVC